MIRRKKKRTSSQFNDTNRGIDVQKSNLEVILMIQMEDRKYEKEI